MSGAGEDAARPERFRFMVGYAIGGDLRYISHHDTLRMFRRVLARAEVPVRFSEGFNPHPRINLPLPRPVGVSSDAEALVIELNGAFDGGVLRDRIELHTPDSIRVTDVRRLGAEQKSVQPDRVRYRLDLGGDRPADLASRIQHVLESTVAPVERRNATDGHTRTVNIRPYVVQIRDRNTNVEFTLQVTGSGSARPAEIAELLGWDVSAVNHRIHRMEVQWK